MISECPICYELLVLRITPCSHSFCESCLPKLTSCALCRYPLHCISTTSPTLPSTLFDANFILSRDDYPQHTFTLYHYIDNVDDVDDVDDVDHNDENVYN